MRTAIIFLILSLSACEMQTRYRFTFGGSENDKVLFQSALDEWNTCGVVYGEIIPRGGIPVQPVDSFPKAGRMGYTIQNEWQQHRQIQYLVSLEPNVKRKVMMHELGHVYRGDTGESHDGVNPNGVMRPGMNINARVVCSDLDVREDKLVTARP